MIPTGFSRSLNFHRVPRGFLKSSHGFKDITIPIDETFAFFYGVQTPSKVFMRDNTPVVLVCPSNSLITSLVVGRSSGFLLTHRLMSLRKVPLVTWRI